MPKPVKMNLPEECCLTPSSQSLELLWRDPLALCVRCEHWNQPISQDIKDSQRIPAGGVSTNSVNSED